MSRLTKVVSIHANEPEFYEANIDLYPEMMGYEHQQAEMDCINKLGRLEDIEDLCEKIVSQPIYEKYVDTGEIHEEDYTEYRALYNFKERTIEIYDFEFINGFKLDNYRKTWALTKEKLL